MRLLPIPISRQTMRVLSFVIFVLLLSGIAVAEQPTDPDLRRKIVGTWSGVELRPGVEVRGTNTLKSNGEFEVLTTIKRSGAETLNVQAVGVWSVGGGVLTQTVTKSNSVSLVPVGNVTRDKIVKVTARTLELESENGRHQFRERK